MDLVITQEDINLALVAVQENPKYLPSQDCPAGQSLKRRFKDAQKIQVGITQVVIDNEQFALSDGLRSYLRNWDIHHTATPGRFRLTRKVP